MSKLLKIYLTILPMIRRKIATMVANPDDVEDVLQETFERIYRAEKRSGLNIRSYRTYLYNTARNIALNELNRKSNKVTSYLDDLSMEEPIDDQSVEVDEQVSSRLKLEAFQNAVSSLPTQCRKVFLLNKLYGLKQREIAHQLGISVGTVEKHLAKGLLKCREHMCGQGYPREVMRLVKPVQSMKKMHND